MIAGVTAGVIDPGPLTVCQSILGVQGAVKPCVIHDRTSVLRHP